MVLGLQHLALMSEDIFRTRREMRKRSSVGGFEFTPTPLPIPYRNLKARAGDVLMNKQIKEELMNDLVVKLLTSATEEGQKVARNGGQTSQAVSRRIAPSL